MTSLNKLLILKDLLLIFLNKSLIWTIPKQCSKSFFTTGILEWASLLIILMMFSLSIFWSIKIISPLGTITSSTVFLCTFKRLLKIFFSSFLAIPELSEVAEIRSIISFLKFSSWISSLTNFMAKFFLIFLYFF